MSRGCCRHFDLWTLLISCFQKFAEKFFSTMCRGSWELFCRDKHSAFSVAAMSRAVVVEVVRSPGFKLTPDRTQMGAPVEESCSEEVPGVCVCVCVMDGISHQGFVFSPYRVRWCQLLLFQRLESLKEENEFPGLFIFLQSLVAFTGNLSRCWAFKIWSKMETLSIRSL